jgi:signal transduction histidine kinase
VAQYFTNSLKLELQTRANATSGYLTEYMSADYSTFYGNAQKTVDDFSEKDKLEMQIIDSYGRIIVSSSGISAGVLPGTSDVSKCFATMQLATTYGKDETTGERVVSASAPVFSSSTGSVMGAVRYISSARVLNKQLRSMYLLLAAAYLLVLGFILISNLFFLRSIVNPTLQITTLAQNIAAGQYGATLDAKFNDEMGTLCTTVNHMSREIARTEKMKNDFISTVSHELKTPLTSIGGWAETIAHDPSDDDTTRQGLSIIIKETHRLSRIVEELLEFSRLEGSTFKLNVTQLDICDVIQDSVFTYKEMLEQSGMTVNFSGLDESIITHGDRDRLLQVFLNIIDNAAKYGSDGKRLDIGVTDFGSECKIVFKDYGAGIPPDELPFVKDKFYKGSSKGRGTGIGLSVCNEIIKLHGGKLDIQSEYGKNTVVTVVLPVK